MPLQSVSEPSSPFDITSAVNDATNQQHPITTPADTSPSSSATGGVAFDRPHSSSGEALETSVDYTSSSPDSRLQSQKMFDHARTSMTTTLSFGEMLLLHVRGLKNKLVYCDIDAECSEMQSCVVGYCCSVWKDFSARFGFTNTASH